MAITTLLELHFAEEHLIDGPVFLSGILRQTRGFDGCLGIEVLTDIEDPGHIVVVEQWESNSHDLAYRAWRAGEGATPLRDYLTGAPGLTKYEMTAAS
jgi:quinol monooxygenase YgiN